MDKGKTGETYIIAGLPHTLIDALALAERITGVRAPRIPLNPTFRRVGTGLMGILLPVPEDYASETLRTMAGVTHLDNNAKARRELG